MKNRLISFTPGDRRDTDAFATLTETFGKDGPAVSGICINIAPDSGARRGERALLFVDLCMSTDAELRKPLKSHDRCYFIWHGHRREKDERPTSHFYCKTYADAWRTSKVEPLHFLSSRETAFGDEGTGKVMLRLLFQAKTSWVASRAAQTLCSRLLLEDFYEHSSGKAAEIIYLVLMHDTDGAMRNDLRLCDLKVLDGWTQDSAGLEKAPANDPAPAETDTKVDGEHSGRSEELRQAFATLLRKVAKSFLQSTWPASKAQDDHASEMVSDYVSAARVLTVLRGRSKERPDD